MRKIGWLALFCLALATYLGKSWETSLPPNDSAFHATVALHATEKGWIPQLPIPGIRSYNTSDAAGFNDHPFPLFVLDGMIQRKLGPGGFSARLLPALLAAGTILLTAALGGALESAALGWTAALLLLFTPEYIKSAASFHLDVPMIFPILLSFWLWRKGKWSLAGLAAGLGCWIKTPVSLLVVPVAACVIFLRREKALRGSWIRMALVALLSAGSYWVLVRAIAGPEIVRDYWVRQVWGTAVGGRGGGERDLGMFFSYLRHHFLPWVLLLLPSAYVIWRDKLWRRDSVLIPLVAIAILAIVISPMRFKYDYYFLPAFPFLTLICAQSFRKWLPAWEPALPTAILMTALAMVTFLLTTPVELGPEAFPALRKFEALIQSYGSCEDQVLFVEGEQPYGSTGDFSIELAYYTGRPLVKVACDALEESASKPQAGWVLLAGSNVDRCATARIRAQFPRTFRFGNQVLLSRRIPASDAVDLTPLGRELKPAQTCQAQPFMRDRYH